ncbi:MAG: FAD-dependent oxidoreductase [Candidatus Sumerlaeia bacterium]|nr:FAD-dependent oxidoreductase [Candidatus Sumerlaeia bacterium]
MTDKTPRHPIAIIGAGIAGLSAAHTLEEAGIPTIVLERFDRAGGRLNTRQGGGWVADHGTSFITTRHTRVCDLIRTMGMETSRVAIQGSVRTLTSDLKIEIPENGGLDGSRFSLVDGFGFFMEELAGRFQVHYNMAVGAVRWDNNQKVFWWNSEGQVFWFEDEDGQPLRDPVTHKVIIASGVILATTGTASRRIIEKSPSLAGLLPEINKVDYTSTFTTMFKIPRIDVPWYALEGKSGAPFTWIALEERKSPARVPDDKSLIVAHASPSWSIDLIAMHRMDAMAQVYRKLREIIPQLPEEPLSQTYKRWNVSRVQSRPMVDPDDRPRINWPVNPPTAPFALAGDYVYGRTAEDAALSGHDAAQAIITQLPTRKSVLGIHFAE